MKAKKVAEMLKKAATAAWDSKRKFMRMAVLCMVGSKILSGCSQEDVQASAEQIAEATGLNPDNMTTVFNGVVNSAKAVDRTTTAAADLGLGAVARITDFFGIGETEDEEMVIPSEFKGGGDLSVHFIDVGQGDAILLSYTEDGNTEYALIDAGDNSKGTAVQKYLMDNGVDHLKYLILTHPDADHIGGADVIISKFDIDKIYMSGVEKDTATYRDVIDAIEYRSYKYEVPAAGTAFHLGAAEMLILAAPTEYEDVNNDSLVVKASYGDSSFLFMGDAEFEEEEELLQMFADVDDTLDVDVLKAGHHGSYSSSSNEFIAEVTPQWTVISCGMDNQYGHPHNTTLYNLADYESDLFRTDIQGTIICTTNGTSYEWNKQETQNWKSGEEITEADYEYGME